MKKRFPILKIFVAACIVIVPVIFTSVTYPWGFWGHKKINYMAVFTMPPELFGFYKKHIEYLSAHAVDADRRRYSDKNEAPRHFMDMEFYRFENIDSIPRQWNAAVKKYSMDSMVQHGILPWYLDRILYKLTEAFKAKDVDKILYLSANIGHYIADAHVPLHTTSNYNGQFTGQTGIHGLWESRIPELMGEHYDFFAGQAEYLDKPAVKIWNIIRESHLKKDSVLALEKKLSLEFPDDRKFSFVQKGEKMQKAYSESYSEAYSKLLGGMIERRMLQAIHSTGCFWYTAWVNAGQPDLSDIENKNPADTTSGDEKSFKGKLLLKGHTEE